MDALSSGNASRASAFGPSTSSRPATTIPVRGVAYADVTTRDIDSTMKTFMKWADTPAAALLAAYLQALRAQV